MISPQARRRRRPRWATRSGSAARVAVPPGRTVRAGRLGRADDPVELLGPPRVIARAATRRTIAYPLVVWRTGGHIARAPRPAAARAPTAGWTRCPAQTVHAQRRQRAARGPPPTPRCAPQPRADFVPAGPTHAGPAARPPGARGRCSWSPLHWWWRRRGKPASAAPALRPADRRRRRSSAGPTPANRAPWRPRPTARLRRALAARLPARHSGLDTEALLAQLAAQRPDWPLAELGDVLRSLDEARFGDTARCRMRSGSPAARGELEPRLLPEAA